MVQWTQQLLPAEFAQRLREHEKATKKEHSEAGWQNSKAP